MSQTTTGVIVIGAGLAGLGAAAKLRELGCPCIVLEAANRIGGRAWTVHPPALGGAWFDMGAMWLHDAENNPLTPIARAAGDTLLRSEDIRTDRTFIGNRLATPAEAQDYAAAWPRYAAKADALLNQYPDVPMSEIARNLPDDPWAATVEAWEAPVICTVDAAHFSARDWQRNALGGTNLMPDGGVGAFVERRLGQGLDIRLDTPVTRIRWGKQVSVETMRGTLTAGACIVTVSTGVLASGALAFDPPLPAATTEAIHALPMGLAVKVALRATGPDRLDLPTHCSVDRRVERAGDPLMPFQCWPFGRDYVQGWVGGAVAWELAKAGQGAAVDFAISQLRALFGGRVDALFRGGGQLVTAWDADPWTRGAYSYAVPNQAGARAQLAASPDGGTLLFAGEACHHGFAGTVAGAWISGQEAATRAAIVRAAVVRAAVVRAAVVRAD